MTDDNRKTAEQIAAKFFAVECDHYARLVREIVSALNDRDQEHQWEMMGEDL